MSIVNMSTFPPSTVKCHQRKWSVGEEIGSGGFARVFSVRSNGFDSYVAKFIPKARGAQRELLFTGVNDLKNVVPVADWGESGDYWIIVMPRAEKSLADLLASQDEKLPDDTTRSILEDIATAILSMKEGGVVHRDIKPDNILLLDGHWCLADFGIFRYAEATTAEDTRKYARTPAYAAPEQWKGDRATNATDVYAFGVVAYQLCTGDLPFPEPEIDNYMQQHLEELPGPVAGIPTALASLIESCLMEAPGARPAPDTILSELRRSLKPLSEPEQNLQAANARIIRRNIELTRKESAEQSERERKEELQRAAGISIEKIIIPLAERIRAFASQSVMSRDPSIEWSIRLGHATLSVATVSREDRIVKWDDTDREILAFSNILLRVPPDLYGREGRSHSLWYYQEEEGGGFRWYELAFKNDWSVPHQSAINPFALPPGSPDAGLALRGVIHTISMEKHPCPIDQGNEEAFIGRWITHFAQAAQ